MALSADECHGAKMSLDIQRKAKKTRDIEGWIRISIVSDGGKVLYLASNIHSVTRYPYHLNTVLARLKRITYEPHLSRTLVRMRWKI